MKPIVQHSLASQVLSTVTLDLLLKTFAKLE
jgi:hypothetical protein